MIRAPVRATLICGIGVIAAAALALVSLQRKPDVPSPRPANLRPTLLLLTSLPIMFGENFSINQHESAALKALKSRYRVVPISVADSAGLGKGRLLLMAQPLPQPAEDLVTLDRWVRGGGRVLLLADPMLEWPSARPLGDPLRPPPMFMDTGLLGHWGLRLDAPDDRGPQTARLHGFRVAALSPGRLFGDCRITSDRIVADCRVGRGRAIVVADADFLGVERIGPAAAAENLDWLLFELASLERS